MIIQYQFYDHSYYVLLQVVCRREVEEEEGLEGGVGLEGEGVAEVSNHGIILYDLHKFNIALFFFKFVLLT